MPTSATPPAVIPPAVIRRRPGPDLPPIRLRPAPALEPPFDDEPSAPTWVGPGIEQMAFELGDAAERPHPASRAAPHRTARAGASAESMGAVHRFLRLCLEIFNGYRPAGHVRPLTSVTEAATVIEQLWLIRERVAPPGHRRARRPAQGPAAVAMRHLRVCEPRGGVAEAAVVLGAGAARVAFAVRLERRRDRWLCTAALAV